MPLAAVADPTEVPAAVASGIGLTGPLGDRPLAPVLRTLRDRQALLVLDNCEQVAAACGELVASLLAACPTVTVLATSRIPLEMPAEEVFAIPPMGGAALPSDPFSSDATALFLDRATSVAGGYALTEHNAKALGEICDVLHGLPLAIELAASWIPVLSPLDLLDHLRQADIALASGTAVVEERHRSLAMILDSSWRWLSAKGAYSAERVGDLRRRFHPGSSRSGCRSQISACLPHWRSGRLFSGCRMRRVARATRSTNSSVSYALRQLEDDGPIRARHFAYFLELVESLETSWNTQLEPLWSNPDRAPIWPTSAPP